jgi:single-strand DNA-binding protein
MCYLGVAVNRTRKENDEWKQIPSFFNFSIFGKKAEGICKYMAKGQPISLEGHLEEDRWTKDGVTHSKMAVGIDRIQIIGGLKKKDEGSAKDETDQESPENITEEEYPDSFSEIDSDFDLGGIEGEEIS